MFPAVLMSMMMKPARLKTEMTFTAEDPWNHNQRTEFALDRYLMAMKGVQLKPNARAFNGSYFYGIRSEIDGVDRMLPESLGYLWRNGKLPAEALPRLLKEMQPTLRKTDFRLQFLTKFHTFLLYFVAVAGGLSLILIAAGIVIGGAGLDATLVIGIIYALLFGLVYLVLLRPRARRKKQMTWALARA